VAMLATLDDILADLRAELKELSPVSPIQPPDGGGTANRKTAKIPDYSGVDLTKAKRLINAREGAIKSVKSLLAQRRSDL
jgi:hypothetical protein